MQIYRNMQFIVIFTEICKYMQNKKLTIESTHYETSTFLIKIILGEL